MRNKNYEGKACDAVVKAIEKRTSKIRAHIRHPEVDRIGPPVDLRLKIGNQEYAIEHTLIEPFENQIKMEVIIKRDPRLFQGKHLTAIPESSVLRVAIPN